LLAQRGDWQLESGETSEEKRQKAAEAVHGSSANMSGDLKLIFFPLFISVYLYNPVHLSHGHCL
jgi:hypothetical protein